MTKQALQVQNLSVWKKANTYKILNEICETFYVITIKKSKYDFTVIVYWPADWIKHLTCITKCTTCKCNTSFCLQVKTGKQFWTRALSCPRPTLSALSELCAKSEELH